MCIIVLTAAITIAFLSRGLNRAANSKHGAASELLKHAPYVSCAIGSLAIPVSYDSNGLPMINLLIGSPSQLVRLVVDTGSPDLMVKVPRSFNPSSSSSLKRADKSTCSRVAFGTQADHVCWMRDSVALAGRCVQSITELKSSDSASLLPQGRVDYEDVWFLGSNKRERSEHAEPNIPVSNYDVIGLARNHSGEDLLSQLASTRSSENDGGDGLFTFIFGDDDSKGHALVAHLVIGRIDNIDYKSLHTVFDPDFFRVELRGMQVGNLSVHPCPKHAIIDSGSNYVFAPPDTVAALKKRMKTKQNLVLDFGPMRLQVPPSAYLAPDGGFYIEVSHSPPNVLVLGTMFMRNIVIEFDSSQRSVRMASL